MMELIGTRNGKPLYILVDDRVVRYYDGRVDSHVIIGDGRQGAWRDGVAAEGSVSGPDPLHEGKGFESVVKGRDHDFDRRFDIYLRVGRFTPASYLTAWLRERVVAAKALDDFCALCTHVGESQNHRSYNRESREGGSFHGET